MADLERIVKIIFAGDDQVSTAARNAAGAVTQFSTVAESAAKPLAGLADKILAVDKVLAALTTVTLAYSAYKFAEFETSTTSLTKILATELKPLAGEVTSAMIEMSNEFGISSSVLLDTATSWKRAGFDISELNKLTKDSVVLFTAAAESEFELGMATETLVRILKGFNTGAEDSARVTDVLNKLANEYATSVSMLGEGMARLSPNANIMGLSIEELGGILVPAIEVFQSGEIASTALNTSFLKLIDPSAKVQEALAGIGVHQRDANGAMKSGKEVLYEVAEAFRTVDENEKLQVATQLVGIRQATKFITVIDRWDYAMKAVEVASKAGGSALEELTARMEDSRKQADRVVAAFNNLAIIIGGQYNDATKAILSGVAELEIAMQNIITNKTFQPIFDRINSLGLDLGDAFQKIAKLLPDAMQKVDFSSFLKEIDDLTGSITNSFSSLDLTSSDGLTAALQGIVDTITSVLRITSGMVDQFKVFFSAIGEGILQLNEMDEETAQAFGQLLGSAKLVVAAGAEIAGAFFIIQQSGADIENVFNAVVGSVRFLWNGIQTAFDTAIKFYVEGILKVVEFAEKAAGIPGVPESWRKSITNAKESLIEFNEAVEMDRLKQTEEMLNGASQAWDGFTGKTREAKKAVEETDTTLAGIGQDADKNLADLITKLGDTAIMVEKIPSEKKLTVGAAVDQPSIDTAQQAMGVLVGETASGKKIYLMPELDQAAAAKAKTDIETQIPADKQLEIQAKLEVAQMEQVTEKFKILNDTIQSQIEWKAKLDIAEVEANAKIIEVEMAGLSNAFSDASAIIGNSLGVLADLDFSNAGAVDVFRLIKEQMEVQNDLQERSLEMQIEMSKITMENLRLKNQKLQSGEALYQVQIDGSSLQTELHSIALAMLKYIQAQAVDSEMLLA